MIWAGYDKEGGFCFRDKEVYVEGLGHLCGEDGEIKIYSQFRYSRVGWSNIITAIHKNKKSVWIEFLK